MHSEQSFPGELRAIASPWALQFRQLTPSGNYYHNPKEVQMTLMLQIHPQRNYVNKAVLKHSSHSGGLSKNLRKTADIIHADSETQLLPPHWSVNVQEPFSWAILQPDALAAALCSH
ncbi:hypothetical protein STEG23_014840 [Scotinomys teguina]